MSSLFTPRSELFVISSIALLIFATSLFLVNLMKSWTNLLNVFFQMLFLHCLVTHPKPKQSFGCSHRYCIPLRVALVSSPCLLSCSSCLGKGPLQVGRLKSGCDSLIHCLDQRGGVEGTSTVLMLG